MAESNAEKLRALEERLVEAEAQVNDLKNEAASARQQLQEARTFVNDNLPVAQSSINDIRAFRESSVTAADETKSVATQTKEKLEELEDALDEVLGHGGLHDQATAAIDELSDQQKKQQEGYEALVKKLDGLLPGASSVGLAQAYKDQKNSYKTGSFFWPGVFIVAVGAIVVIGLSSFSEITSAPTLDEAYVRVIARLPYYVAAVWLAAFASKRQSQNKRLQEEYAHKEALALSLEGYKREVQDMEDESLMTKLMGAVVDMVAFNPSVTLDGKHGDDSHPLNGIFKNWKKDKPATEQE